VITDAQPFLAAILAAPTDDAPRLVYADWLLAAGDRLGELIVAQLEQTAHPGDVALERRVAGLISAHARDVIGDMPVSKPVFRRGFIEAAEINVADFVRMGPQLFERLPLLVELVVWLERASAGVELCSSPLFARLRRLCLRYGDVALEALTANPHLRGLEQLELTSCDVDERGCERLAACPHFDALRGLELGLDPIGAPGLARLGKAKWAPGLRHLRVWKAKLGPASLGPLASFRALETLELGFNGLDVAALEALAPLAPSLRSLTLRGDRLGAPLLRNLAGLSLAQLDLEGARIEDDGVAALASLALDGLETLNLSGNGLTATGVRRLLELPLPRLRRLVLRHNEVGPCAKLFARELINTRVELDEKVLLPGR
jgi:uncharacterized protein (TIGR02996 family)